MKKLFIIFLFMGCFTLTNFTADAQCSICNKTVMQMGTKPAQGFNTGILYLMFIPYAAVGFIGYKWWKSQKDVEE